MKVKKDKCVGRKWPKASLNCVESEKWYRQNTDIADEKDE